jgi:protein ImuB
VRPALTPHEPSCAEIFVALSPRVQFRDPGFIFIDIESTSGLLGGEDRALKKAFELASALSSEVTGAIADHPAVAQVLAAHRSGFISPDGCDFQTLKTLPIVCIKDLEGLKSWPRIRQVEHIISFFQNIGIQFIEQILFFELPSFRERWGEMGLTLWKRLHGREEQTISPLIPCLPLTTYGYFDDPISMVQLLMPRLSTALRTLFLRIEARGRFVKSMGIYLHCEYSEHKHFFSIEPVSPGRDQQLFEDLLERKLSETDLQNPIREFEIELFDMPEKTQQLDFFEPRDLTEDRWKRLISFARQAQVEVGFLEMQPKHFPEDSFELKSDWPTVFSGVDVIEKRDQAIQVKAVHSKGLLKAPRPTLLLEEPLPLSEREFSQYRKLSFFPLERIDASWWAKLRPDPGAIKKLSKYRDYYFALSQEGQLVWIYQDRLTKGFYLHGYFD